MKPNLGPLADEGRAVTTAALERKYARRIVEDLKWLVGDPHGRRILSRLIFDVCGVMYGPPWNPSADIHRVAGRREVGEDLLKRLEDHAPHETKLMIGEWFSDRQDQRIALERSTGKQENDE